MTSTPLHSEGSHRARPVRRVDDRLMGLIMAGLLFVVAAISLARSSNQVEYIPAPVGAPIMTRSLTFVDGRSGDLQVYDAVTGDRIETFDRGEGSFVRGAIRTLARARQLRGTPVQDPVVLSGYQDNRLVLSDPVSGESIELSAFGSSNAGEFGKFLTLSTNIQTTGRTSGVYRE